MSVQPEATDRDPLDTGPSDVRDPHRGPVRRRRSRPPGRRLAPRHRAADLADPAAALADAPTSAAGCGRPPSRPRPTVFADNLRDLLLAAPAGEPRRRWAWTRVCGPAPRSPSSTAPARWSRPTPSTRTSRTTSGRQALADPRRLITAHGVQLIAIGNGTASRETDRLAAELVAAHPGVDQGGGVRGGRLGLLGVGLRRGRTARTGRVDPRGGLHRPPAAGPARRAGQDRPEVDRGGPVPARHRRGHARPLAGQRGRGLRERCRGRRQHRVGAAAGPGLRHHHHAGREHRRATGTPTAPSVPAGR